MLLTKFFICFFLFFFEADSISGKPKDNPKEARTIENNIKKIIVTVGIGESKTVKDEESCLFTDSLTYCSALALLSQHDKSSGIYMERTLMHINGSCFETGINNLDTNQVFRKFKTSSSTGSKRKVCLIAGRDASSTTCLSIILRQENTNGEKHILDLFEIGGADTSIAVSMTVKVMPNGEIELSEPNPHDRGLLPLPEKEKILQKCKDD